MGIARSILINRQQTWHAAAFQIFAAHSMARAFRGNHKDIDIRTWLNQVEMHIQAVGKGNGRARAHMGSDFF